MDGKLAVTRGANEHTVTEDTNANQARQIAVAAG